MTTTAQTTEVRSQRAADSVHELFEQVAARSPGAPAVVLGDQRLSYAELNARANRLARRLRTHGVGRHSPVALCVERSLDMVIALLGILKAGGCYVALDPLQPTERHAALLSDTRAPLLLTQEKLLPGLDGLCETIVLDRPAARWDADEGTDLGLAVHPEQAAYVAYTSGSTGAPKGVLVPHRAVLRLARRQDFLTLEPGDAVLQFAPLAFDASTLELWAPLLNGARLVIQPAGETGLDQLADTVERQQVTTMWLTAGLFHQMVEGPLGRLKGVRRLLAGGDTLSVPHVNRALTALPGVRLINGYGPTENTTFTCCHVMTDQVTTATVPIGTALNGTRVHVLDELMRPVAAGSAGELYAGGDGLALGYLGKPARTAERFLPDPFDADPGARLYRTGDRVRQLPDGTMEFLGRTDNQVKVRGYRIEPGEVEAALLRDEEITDAAVVARNDSGTGRSLVAFFVAERRIPVPELRRRLAVTLPPYMIPSVFVRTDELPLTPNGKVDRVALANRPSRRRPDVDSDFRAAGCGTEESLARIWADLMEFDEIGVDDDFFELGGHSLLATRITSEIAATWQVDIRPRTFYENPTVAELAEVVEELRT